MISLLSAIHKLSSLYPNVQFKNVRTCVAYVGMKPPISVKMMIERIENLTGPMGIRVLINPASLTINTGSHGTVTVNITRVNYYTGNIDVKAENLPRATCLGITIDYPNTTGILTFSAIPNVLESSAIVNIIITPSNLSPQSVPFYLEIVNPVVKVTVPNVVNKLLSEADKILKASNLHYNLTNPGLYSPDSVKVVNQSPGAGSQIDDGGTVWLTVSTAMGIKGFQLTNQSSHPSLDIYVWDSKTNSWNNKGTLTAGNTMTISFESNAVYTVEALDPGKKPPNDRPYWEQNLINGDSNGQVLPYVIY